MRLIDADDFLTQIAKRLEYIERRREHLAKHLHFFMMDGAIAGELRRTIETIKNAPAIDAAPVVHARWVPRGSADYDAGMFYCSACKDERYFGDEVSTSEEAEKYAHFCPNCGAKMDGGDEE